MRTVFFDIDTQLDFLYPAGALYVPGAESIVPALARLNRYAADHEIPLVSDVDAHSENDPEFRHWPSHCVAGTLGQQKPASTLIESRGVMRNVVRESIPVGVRQIIFEKQSLDCFGALNTVKLLDHFKAERYVVYGVVTEICVRHAAIGLLNTGARVELVTDAVRSLDDQQAQAFFDAFESQGGKLTTVAGVCI